MARFSRFDSEDDSQPTAGPGPGGETESSSNTFAMIDIAGLLKTFDVCSHGDELGRISQAFVAHQKLAALNLLRDDDGRDDKDGSRVSFGLHLPPEQIESWRKNDENLAPRVIATICTQRGPLSPKPASRGEPADSTGKEFKFNLIHEPRGRGFRAHRTYYDHEKWLEELITALEAALEHGAHIISFGEFDYPPGLNAKQRSTTQTKITEILDSVKDRPVMLFAGSYHDWDTSEAKLSNTGMIFVNEILRDTRRTFPVRHEKMISAKSLGELLSPRNEPTLVTYDFPAFGGRIAILICIDVFDSTVLDAIEARSRFEERDRISLVLVPAYNGDPRVFSSCQKLSYRANCIVVYVNSLNESAWDNRGRHEAHRKSEVFVCGIPMKTWKCKSDYLKTLALDFRDENRRMIAALNIPKLCTKDEVLTLAGKAEGIACEDISPASSPFVVENWVIPRPFPDHATELVRNRMDSSTNLINSYVAAQEKRDAADRKKRQLEKE